tara:strand:+ start:100 stop:237 length:138 start_codon:yes stop_codon:yes gene_type:complete
MKKQLIDYVNWNKICEDNNLNSGDISFDQTIQIELLIQEFIEQNK